MGAGALGDSTVFGVEKPRLVLNEAYSEIVNDPVDPPDGAVVMGVAQPPGPNAHVRFWVELLNPTTTPYAAGGTGPLGDGAAQLRYPANFSPYRIEITRALTVAGAANAGVIPHLQAANNVTGGLDPTITPEIRFLFDDAAVNVAAKQRVLPNSAAYNPVGNPAAGMIVVGPTVAGPKTDEYDPANPTRAMPAVPTAWYGNMIQAAAPGAGNGQNAMSYQTALPAPGATNRVDYKRHVILLRRLANPYAPPNDPSEPGYNAMLPANHWLTVDYKDWVPSFDAIHRAVGQGNSRGSGGANGYTPLANRHAIGKVQPYAGLSVGAIVAPAVDPTYTFPTSMVLAQTTAPAGEPRNTFGRHNGTTAAGPAGATFNAGPPATLADGANPETVMTPYDWLVHLDRPLVNQLELLHVTTTKGHLLTQQFLTPGAGGSVNKFSGSAQTVILGGAAPFQQLYRARCGMRCSMPRPASTASTRRS
jgi:hypothetical protein